MNFKKFMFLFVLICIIVFLIFYYIFYIFGNNKNRNQDKVVEDILNKLNNYEANIEVVIKSNKTENKYNMTQVVEGENSKSIVNYPENIKDMTIELNGEILRVTNSKINMEKFYNDYKAIINNSLFLNSFVNDYKNNTSKIYEKENEIIIEINTNNNSNTYANFKELHLDKEKKMPKELIIKDTTKKDKIRIIYNDIKIK